MAGHVSNDPALISALIKLFSHAPSRDLIKNLDIQLHAETFGDTVFPVSISDPPNCYICCPSAAYIDYALEETRHFTQNAFLQKMLGPLIRACKPLARATGLDHQVQVNNWLFSTNPLPQFDGATAIAMRDHLLSAHASRAIVLRSLNAVADGPTIRALQSAGFVLLPARQVYVIDPLSTKRKSGDMKRDAKLLARSKYTQIDAHSFSDDDWARAARLYEMLYIDKYTPLNPHYTASFLAKAHQIGLLKIIGLRQGDRALDGVLGMFINGQSMTVPLIGYDTGKPQEDGLYRQLNAIAQDHASRGGHFYNQSAGAANFKRNRNAVAAIEYSAVYVAHLGAKQRVATQTMRMLLSRIGVPLMRRFRL